MFSTRTCWPNSSERRPPRIRATVSEALPAANGTTMLTGRTGQTCAAAGMIAAANATAPVMRLLMLVLMLGIATLPTPRDDRELDERTPQHTRTELWSVTIARSPMFSQMIGVPEGILRHELAECGGSGEAPYQVRPSG